MTDRTLLTRARDALKRGDTRETFYNDSRGDTSGPVIDAIDAFLAQPAAPVVPDGWVSVPREPTPEMVEAPFVGKIQPQDWTSHKRSREMMAENYRAMIAAAPQAVPAPVVPNDAALNTLARLFHNGEEVEGDDGAAMMVDMALWHEASEALDSLIGHGDEETLASPAAPAVREPDTRKLCTCDGAGRGPGRACVVQAGGRLGDLWRCAHGITGDGNG